MFIILYDHPYTDLCDFVTRQHTNGVIVRLYDNPIGMVVWNGFSDTDWLDDPSCSVVLTEAQFFAADSLSAAIFVNRLFHLNGAYTVSVIVIPMPPSVFVVADVQRRWSRLAGTDVSMLRFIMLRVRTNHILSI